ncbi:hypothetical protein TL16_g00174 [Triparma laevis f. inornata]|uniref:Uncharacterized protein n=1 Tax=Triparma laevis f. inornata TaxID=1714386 RepID=A0A9W6ZD20_9STRA|nr:hypothetical protein TL16_g00174 [Triparma laevis f. inornata]
MTTSTKASTPTKSTTTTTLTTTTPTPDAKGWSDATQDQRTVTGKGTFPPTWSVKKSTSNHYKITAPDGKSFSSKTKAFQHFEKSYPEEYGKAAEENGKRKAESQGGKLKRKGVVGIITKMSRSKK